MFGGLTETYEVTNDLWAFDLRRRTWTWRDSRAGSGAIATAFGRALEWE